MRAAELIRLLEQYDPDLEVPVSFTDQNGSAVPHITTCADGERNRCYEHLVERAEDGMLVVNAGGLITYMNPYLVRLTGYNPAELAGRPLQHLLAGDDADILQRRLCAGAPAGGRRFTVRLQTRQQHMLWVQMSVTPVPSSDGQFRGCMMTVTDLSQQQHHLNVHEQQSLGNKVEWIHDQLDRLKLLRSHLLTELEQMSDQPRIDATPFWHQGRYLYLIQPQINGKRTRRYIGSQPDNVKDALAAIRRHQRYEQIQQELQHIDSQIRAAGFRLDGFLWEIAQLPPDLHRLLPATVQA
ncbi:PAS domain S-box protein [Oceanospirillaceae bacterium ASx5O]|nr:PAS domain S-box protein [Oceanospirillaceae bacterium ASx5O]